VKIPRIVASISSATPKCFRSAKSSTATISSRAIYVVRSVSTSSGLMDLGCYRGLRHRRGLPVRGQRTHTTMPHAQGPGQGHRRQEEVIFESNRACANRGKPVRHAPFVPQCSPLALRRRLRSPGKYSYYGQGSTAFVVVSAEHRLRVAHVNSSFNNTDHHHHRRAGATRLPGPPPARWASRLAQVDPVCRAGAAEDVSRRRRNMHAHAGSEVAVPFGPRVGRCARSRPRASPSPRSRRDHDPAQRLPSAQASARLIRSCGRIVARERFFGKAAE